MNNSPDDFIKDDDPVIPDPDPVPEDKIFDIVIIGAGLSGLVAAYELANAGHNVTVLEARDRVGGRVFTYRSPFSNGNFVEAGASRIPPNHNYTLSYINKFKLQLDHFYPREGQFAQLNGTSLTLQSASNFLNSAPWIGSVNHSDYKKLSGGTEQLPKAFANHLGDKIHLNTPVESVDQTGEKIKIVTKDQNVYQADKVICTVPVGVLNKISFTPNLSQEKQNASNGDYAYSDSSRFFLQCKNRFWENDNMNAWGTSDWPEEIWQPTWDRSNDTGIILSYMRYQKATLFDQQTEQEQAETLIARWKNIFPNIEDHIDMHTTHSWRKEEWSNGAWASPTGWQQSNYANHIAAAEGNIHFAGEHASNFHGWMQGAIISGLRAFNEIISIA